MDHFFQKNSGAGLDDGNQSPTVFLLSGTLGAEMGCRSAMGIPGLRSWHVQHRTGPILRISGSQAKLPSWAVIRARRQGNQCVAWPQVASRASQRRRILLSRSKLVQAVPSNQVGPSVKLAVIELKLYELTQANKRWPVEMQGFQGFQDFPGPVSKLPPASTCLVVAPSPPAHVCQHPCLGTAVHVNLHFDAARHQRL